MPPADAILFASNYSELHEGLQRLLRKAVSSVEDVDAHWPLAVACLRWCTACRLYLSPEDMRQRGEQESRLVATPLPAEFAPPQRLLKRLVQAEYRQIIARYDREFRAGEGGFGRVYLVRDLQSDLNPKPRFALKVFE